MAVQLVENLTAEFQPEKYHDEYREELLKLIRAKVEGRQVVEPEISEAPTGNVIDLMERLRQSVEAQAARRGKQPPKEKKPRKRKAAAD